MIPESVLNAIYDQLRPLVIELTRYTASPEESVRMNFEVGSVLFEFKNDEISN